MAIDPRNFRGYLFDLDGTLIDTAPDICAAVNHALERFGYNPAPASLVRHWVGHGGKQCIAQAVAAARAAPGHTSSHSGSAQSTDGHEPVAGTSGTGCRLSGSPGGHAPVADDQAASADASSNTAESALVDEMLEPFLDHYRAHIADNSRPYPHAVDTLRALSERNAKLAVVTNKRMELTRRLLDELELTPWFDAIVGGDTAANPKPAPDPILYACDEIGLSTAEVLFVGDSMTDVRASRAAGCAVVCVPNGYNHGIAPERLGADAIIDSLRELV